MTWVRQIYAENAKDAHTGTKRGLDRHGRVKRKFGVEPPIDLPPGWRDFQAEGMDCQFAQCEAGLIVLERFC